MDFVTWNDLIQYSIMLVALISLFVDIYNKKK